MFNSIKYSYGYEALLGELTEDIQEGIISESDTIKVVRERRVRGGYSPIVDYYYPGYKPKEKHEKVKVSKVMNEMEKLKDVF